MDSKQLSTQRRRSERVSKSVPVIVRGIDLLGQPFEERTSTLALNLHGCRYSSRHHLPKNTWVTLELPQGASRRNLRARVAWIQRPHSVREFFQIAVELESPANIWSLDSPPPDWGMGEAAAPPRAALAPQQDSRIPDESEAGGFSETNFSSEERAAEMTELPPASVPIAPPARESEPAIDSPILREWNAERDRQAIRAAESETARREEFTAAWKLEFERSLQQANELLRELERSTQSLRAENDAALESVNRMAQARLQAEAAAAAHTQQQKLESSAIAASAEDVAADWRQRVEAEMALAQAQWYELLQSSLDSSIERLVEQLSGRSQDVLRGAEQKMSERFAELRQPLAQLHTDAREALSGVKSALEQEVSRARSSLAEIEHAASRMKEYSAQLEAASHDTLNELHRRLENILEAQTEEMNRRVEIIAAGVPQRLAPTLDSLGNKFVERTMAEVESKLAPQVERVPELVRELAAREVEAEESLRLHRERLRQVSENNQREGTAQMAATLANLRGDFEAARKEALTKWNEELDASGVRAAHAAAESIGRSSEWFQQEARARLQVLVEQTLATAGNTFDEKAALSTGKFEARLEEQATGRLAQIHQQLDGVAGEVLGRTRTQLDVAAEAAAASFGQVLRTISEQETGQFSSQSRAAREEREQELQRFTEQLVRNLDANAGASIERFQAQMGSELQASVTEGRGALAAEFASALDGYRAERDAHHTEWVESLDRAGEEAAARHQDRLQTAGDSWMVSSVRRLNEHGQNVIESLMLSANQALRDSCSKVFEGLSEMLRDRPANTTGPVGFTSAPGREVAETPAPHNQSNASGATA
ncbi:MAG TPA: hypothetical protein VJO53_08520 [Candidatus Acidoferrales bacterium]|nr:hypothetical protein [Candidatus Acidoferrales bacterium]